MTPGRCSSSWPPSQRWPGTKVGTTGYCMGGGLSLNAAGRFPDRVGAAARSTAGASPPTCPTAHLLAAQMTATVYVAGAENDDSFDDEQFQRLSAALVDAGVDHTLVTYPAHHGFAVPDNPTFDAAAADRHWQALEELYRPRSHPSGDPGVSQPRARPTSPCISETNRGSGTSYNVERNTRRGRGRRWSACDEHAGE